MQYFLRLLMYFGFKVIFFLGCLNRFLFYPKSAGKKYRKKFIGLYCKFEEIYFNYVYRRVCDCSHAPIVSRAASKIILKERSTKDYGWTFEFTGKETECINLGSFNYLGLNDASNTRTEEIINTIEKYGITACSSASEIGRIPLHYQLEQLTTSFLGTEDTLLCAAGFATNELNLPALLSSKCIVFSDEKNHASLILGLKTSKAKILKYAHNDLDDLRLKLKENALKNEKANGQLFSKIVIVTEGIYSVDGTILNLPKLIELKKMHKAYLFIDDAHGVGVLGGNGRGIFDHWHISPSEVDVLMGTYSKTFASNGGYISGSKVLIEYLRKSSLSCYGSAIPPVVIRQAICSITTLMENDDFQQGNRLVAQLRENTHYLRNKLRHVGVTIYGDEDSQIVPWVLGSVSAVSFAVRELKKRGIAAAGVIYPATALLSARIRLNVSASHTKEDLDTVVSRIEDISQQYGLPYCSFSQKPKIKN